MSLLGGLLPTQIEPPDFSRGDWWVQVLLQLLTLWLLRRAQATLKRLDNHNSQTPRSPNSTRDGER